MSIKPTLFQWDGEAQDGDGFPGDHPNGSGIHDASGRELSNMEAG